MLFRSHWLAVHADENGVLHATFELSEAGTYEVYRGDEMTPAPALAIIDATALVNDDGSPAIGHVDLGPGPHTLELRSLDSAPLDASVPVVLYERRYWDYELAVFETKAPIFGAVGIMRSSGVPNAEITVEDLRTLMLDGDGEARAAVLDRYHVRFVILDPLLRMLYPGADDLLATDPSMERHMVNGDPVFVRRIQ